MPSIPRIDIERAKQLLAQGCTQTQVARRLGCSDSGLATALKRERERAAK